MQSMDGSEIDLVRAAQKSLVWAGSLTLDPLHFFQGGPFLASDKGGGPGK
jgi:hypothetical protein